MKYSGERRSAIDRETLEQILTLLDHDAAKPRAVVRMFVEVFDDVVADPEQCAMWKENLLSSFDRMQKRLDEIRIFAMEDAGPVRAVSLKAIVQRVNQEVGFTALELEDPQGASLQGDPDLLALMFRRILDWAGWVKKNGTTPALRVLTVPSDENRSCVAVEAEAGDDSRMRGPKFLFARSLCARIVKLHGGSIRMTERDNGSRQWVVTLPDQRPLDQKPTSPAR